MAVRATWLADAARMTGYPVREIAGWRGRGHGSFRVIEGVVDHHTADGPNGDYPSLNVVTNGRAGLAGPLANYGLGRTGTVYVIADGAAWHAGASTWAGFRDLNDEFIGIEAESTGYGDWTDAQRDCYPRLCAAICYYIRRDQSRICAHRECCIPKGRKPDPTGIDMNGLRNTVGYMLGDPTNRIPKAGGSADLTPDESRMLTALYQGTYFGGESTYEKRSFGDMLANTYAGMFFGGESTPDQKSVFELLDDIGKRLSAIEARLQKG